MTIAIVGISIALILFIVTTIDYFVNKDKEEKGQYGEDVFILFCPDCGGLAYKICEKDGLATYKCNTCKAIHKLTKA